MSEAENGSVTGVTCDSQELSLQSDDAVGGSIESEAGSREKGGTAVTAVSLTRKRPENTPPPCDSQEPCEEKQTQRDARQVTMLQVYEKQTQRDAGQVLREAKEQEQQQTAGQVATDTSRKAHYGMLFDEFQGLSHLEALELLSRESEAKVRSVLTSMSGEELATLKEELQLIKEAFSLGEFDDEEEEEERKDDDDGSEFVKELTAVMAELHVATTADKLGRARKKAHCWMSEVHIPGESEKEEETESTEAAPRSSVEDIHTDAIRSLAEVTARSIEQFHKAAELILHSRDLESTALEQARCLSQMTIILCKEISSLSKKFTSCLSTVGANEKGDILNPLITGVFLESCKMPAALADTSKIICEVWASNLEEEMRKIRQIIQSFNFIAMDTEFPGVVVRPIGEFRSTVDYQYQLLRCNVDLLKIIQLGLTFMNEDGDYPPGTTTWQFNFKFNLTEDMYSQDSIDLLQNSGLQFKKHEEEGINTLYFAELLMTSGLVLCENVKWLSFHSGYDFGYLVKLLTDTRLPEEEHEFFQILNLFFPAIYDVKYLMKSCKNLKGGLQEVADQLELKRIGRQHQAGSDSLLTGMAFFRMKEVFTQRNGTGHCCCFY
ncbi:UNVERIFIED_CONTAM: hypothetical protein FKN15_057812 [Acipenser sinensis]